jgi:hypothetical protein
MISRLNATPSQLRPIIRTTAVLLVTFGIGLLP